MQQALHFRSRKIYEFYLGIQIISMIVIIIFSKYFATYLDNVHINIFALLFSLYVVVKIIPFIYKFYLLESQDDFQPNLWIAFLDGIFLSFFLYIIRDFYYILSDLFYLYLLMLIILFNHRHFALCSSFTTASYVFLVILQDAKMLLSLSVISHVIFLYLLGYIMSSVMNEINKLELHRRYMYEELKRKNSQLSEMASKDYLTTLYNHQTFYRCYKKLIKDSVISHIPFSVAMLDIDNFKKINDNYGHLAGDIILKEVSSLILANIREKDIAARYGGEEFAILFPSTNPKNGEKICERIRNIIENHSFNVDDCSVKVTISGGIAGAAFSTPYCEHNKFLKFVDQLLYKAKSEGKNQIHSTHQIMYI